MSKFLIAAVAVCALGAAPFAARAADEKKADGGAVTGVLIDNRCGEKKNEAAAAKHPQSCNLNDACVKSGYRIVFGDKHLKLDEKGAQLAKKYLEDAETTRVVVQGTVDGETLKATSIKAAEEEKSEAKEDKAEKKTEKKVEKTAEKSEKSAEKSEK